MVRMLAAAVGECVHVAGVYRFTQIAQEAGFTVHFLGPAVKVERLLEAIRTQRPEVVALSYRLTPEAGRRVLRQLGRRLEEEGLKEGRLFLFGGTPPVAAVAREAGYFERVFDGTGDDRETAIYLRRLYRALSDHGVEGARALVVDDGGLDGRVEYPETLPERVEWQRPYPILRHHFGLPDLEATIRGVAELAESRVLDVISIATDQNCQECFFRPEEMDPEQDGAGGAPVRTEEDLRRIYEASRRGNYPLLRAYSGTRDILRMAEVLAATIHNAWAAVPLTWYSALDGRSNRPLDQTIREAQEAFAWHAQRGIPVESNESHHWSLRDAPDAVAVAMAFLAAYNAKAAGVRHYVAQYMFNTPPATSPAMDLAKMLAKVELIESLHDERFATLRETRVGLSSHPADLLVAKGHLGASVLLQMALRPHIVHVVAFCEADHAATPAEIVESVKIARGAIKDALGGLPDMAADPRVQERKQELVAEAGVILEAIRELAPQGTKDPWADAGTLARAVHAGIIDAPHLRNNPEARGEVVTRIIGGACRAVDPSTERVMPEADRVRRLLDRVARQGRVAARGSMPGV
ncbi:MAG: cobalamin B12-binding domain-containing protein [Limnochordaceae bacterium]|nr:cobalamin B12-binding domain-containing protein [Limnochordaceae bacterium]